MHTPRPSRWPRNAVTAHALSYLMARHVPIEALPGGLTRIRQAAGWLLPNPSFLSADARDIRAARRWLDEARDVARVLGPPPDLEFLASHLGDGVIRSDTAARALLCEAGAGEASDPRVLIDVATWTGLQLLFIRVPVGHRSGQGVFAYTADPSTLGRARAITRTRLRNGVLASVLLRDCLQANHIHVDTVGVARDLHDLLGIRGTTDWVWRRNDNDHPLGKALHRISTLACPVPIGLIPQILAATTTPRRKVVPGEWPLPVEAVRAWVSASPRWTLHDHDSMSPTTVPPMGAPDRLLTGILTAHEEPMCWRDLRDALVHAGLSRSSAAFAILSSPLLYRQNDGYRLLGQHHSQDRPVVRSRTGH